MDNQEIISILKEKQKQVIPLALNEMYLLCKPTSDWVWWVFPSDKCLQNQPKPLITMEPETFFLYLSSFPQEWKYLIQRIFRTISYLKKPLTSIFTYRYHQLHVKRSIKFQLIALSKLDDHNFTWLYDCLRFFKKNFNNYQHTFSFL